jgi:hypothetical protein
MGMNFFNLFGWFLIFIERKQQQLIIKAYQLDLSIDIEYVVVL